MDGLRRKMMLAIMENVHAEPFAVKDAADAILAIPEIKEALAGWGALNPLERAKVIGYPEA